MSDFDWHKGKGEANVRKHGISFDEAESVFADPGRLEMPDLRHSVYEPRQLTIGWSKRARLLTVITSERNLPLPRIISAWRATKRERDEYVRRRRR